MLLQFSLIALKATGNINWSWNLVFAPTYIGLGLTAIVVTIGIAIEVSKVNKEIEEMRATLNIESKTKENKKTKTYHKGNSNKEILEKYKDDTLPVQSMLLEGASNEDIVQLKSSKEYKEQEANKVDHDSEIMDIVDYVNMNTSVSNSEKRKLLLKFKKAYVNNKPTLAPIKYAEKIADSHHKEKKLGTR